jgi:hypothetical protein
LKGGTPAGPRGDEGEGSTLRTRFFAYKKKKAITARAENKTVSGGIAWLLDYFVRSEQHRLRDHQIELLRGFQVNDKLKLSWLLDW